MNKAELMKQRRERAKKMRRLYVSGGHSLAEIAEMFPRNGRPISRQRVWSLIRSLEEK